MFVEIIQDYEGKITSALSFKYRVSVYRDRSMGLQQYNKHVRDDVLHTNELDKANSFYETWAKKMDEQKTLVHITLETHDDLDTPVCVRQKVRAQPTVHKPDDGCRI